MAVAELFVGPAESLPPEEEALDAYSATVSGVAQKLLPSVGSVRVGRSDGRRPEGSGSAVAVTQDGLLVTSAHVIDRATRGTAGPTRSPTWRWSGLGERGCCRSPSATPTPCGSASSSWQWGTRSATPAP
jgi:S1-C subfamily serine protease